MKNRLPTGLLLVAALQFVGPLLLPLSTLRGISVAIWVAVIAVFALLGVNLLRRRAWSRVATIFVQGFNLIVRILYVIGHAAQMGESGPVWSAEAIGFSLLSMLVSGAILYYVDLPDVQVMMA